jgi:hypothetical protein
VGADPTRPDPVRRGAARVATLVALPVALAVAALSLWVFNPAGTGPDRPPGMSPPPVPTGLATVPVTMSAAPLTPEAAEVCRAVVTGLPDRTAAGPQRPVTSGRDQNAAYGEPPVILTCGVAPPSVPPTADVAGLNGVCWYADAGATATTWTTVDREVPVAVTVPGAPDGSGQFVIAFAAAIAAADPRLAAPPSGCP